MDDAERQQLQEELEHFKKEKETIRQLVGQIGGTNTVHRDRLFNILFVLLMVSLFGTDILRHFVHVKIPWLPEMFSLEVAVLLVSIKLIWMIHMNAKVGHFQFWILNSIEFRLTEVAKRVRKIEKELHKAQADKTDAAPSAKD